MRQDFFTRVACVLTVFIFLGNDLLASARAISMMGSWHSNSTIFTPLTSSEPKPVATADLEVVKEHGRNYKADDHTAFIGNHSKDPLGSPKDDIFSIDLKTALDQYSYAYLSYDAKGVVNPEDISKSVNQGEVYTGNSLKHSETWSRATVMLDNADLKNGLNQIRFALPSDSDLAIEVQNVQIELTNDFKPKKMGLKLKRNLANEEDFKILLGENLSIKPFKNKEIEMARIPKNIRNITRGSWGFGAREKETVKRKVRIGVDIHKLTRPADLKEAKVFYFDKTKKAWELVHTEKVDMDKMALEASVPGNTDYFAGLIKSPDMPEASAFLPTAISELEAANPGTGMTIISPPQQSKTGEASVSYPLDIPAGRKGMAPSLAVNYSSDGGTGWLGIGWNLSMPSVSIDTRWGVPTFPTTHQQEVYTMNGKSLVQEGGTKGNRATIQNGAPTMSPIKTGNVHFFEPVMSSYKEIIRKGDGPDNYVWIEIMADGTKNYYGTIDGVNIDPGSVLRDCESCNILKWYLTKTEDEWGNNVIYYYHNTPISSNSNPLKVGGWSVVPNKIVYTGHNSTPEIGSHINTPGKYEIVFETSTDRFDASVSMSTGFKVVDNERLEKVKVNYNGSLVKHYEFHHVTGDFGKTRLSAISEHRNGNEFYRHDFDYYNGSLSFGNEQTFAQNNLNSNLVSMISGELDFLKQPLLNILSVSPIKTTTTFGWTASGGVGLGIAPTGQYFNGKKFTFSGNFGYSESYNRDKRSLQDMNGDGLPDLVRDTKKGRGFYPIYHGENGLEVGPFTDIFNGNQPFFKSTSSTFNYGFDFTLGDNTFFHGTNWNSGKTRTKHFITDYNADGFPDLTIEDSNGDPKILFGIRNALGELEYYTSSENSSNPVIKGVNLPAIEDSDDDLKDIEMVKVWTAPFDGEININATAETFGHLNGETRVAIQLNNNFLTSGFESVTSSLTVDHSISNVAVEKGDIIMFRARSDADGQEDLLIWNPEIEYASGVYLDGNNINQGHSTYEDAFLISGNEQMQISGNQKIKVYLNRSVSNPLTDDVVFKLHVVEKDANEQVLDEREYVNILPAGSTSLTNTTFDPLIGLGTNSINLGSLSAQTIPDSDPLNNYTFFFSVYSTSNVNWRELKFRPTVDIQDDECNTETTIYPVVDFQTYNRIEYMGEKFESQSVTYDPAKSYRVLPIFNYSIPDVQAIFQGATGSQQAFAYMTVKNGSNIYSKLRMAFDLQTGVLAYSDCDAFGNGTNLVLPISGPSVYSLNSPDFSEDLVVEFFINDRYEDGVRDFILNNLNEIRLDEYEEDSWVTLETTQENYNLFTHKYGYLGDRLLHWGQFAWSFKNAVSESTPIPIDELEPDFASIAGDQNNQFDEENPPSNEFFDSNQEAFNPMGQKFFVLGAQRGEKEYPLRTYQINSFNDLQSQNLLSPTVTTKPESLDRYSFFGMHMSIFASKGMLSPGKFGEEEIVDDNTNLQPDNSVFTAWGTKLITRSKSASKTTGVGSNNVSSTLQNSNKYFSYSTLQFQDFNGDGYPDRLSDDGSNTNANFTTPLGGHLAAIQLINQRLSKSITQNSTMAKPGSYVNKDQRWERMGTPSVSFGSNDEAIQHMDLNGDGLPDRLTKMPLSGMTMALNSGYGFQGANPYNGYSGKIGSSDNSSYSLNFNMSKLDKGKPKIALSFKLGVGVNNAANHTNTAFMDLNGDGLSDCITVLGTTATILINTGTSFVQDPAAPATVLTEKLNHANGFGFSGNIAATYAWPVFHIPLLFIDLKMSANTNGGVNWAMNEIQSSLMDVNGDGFVDYVTEDNGNLKVKYSQIGKSNLLKEVTNPLGGSFTIDYDRIGNKTGFYDPIVKTHLNTDVKQLWDMPNSKWVLSSVTMDDGYAIEDNGYDIDGEDQIKMFFAYDGGIKSRREKEFLGFTRLEKRYMPSSQALHRNQNQTTFNWGPYETGQKHYITEVQQYLSPNNNTFNYRKRSEYQKDVLTESYKYYNIQTRSGNENIGFTLSCEVHPIDVTQYTYEFRNVCLDPNDGSFNQLYSIGSGSEAVDWDNISETQTIFPSVIELQKVHYHEVSNPANRDKYVSQKFLIQYDDFWNVTQYEDEGELIDRNEGTKVVDVYTREYYDYKTQQNTLTTSQIDPGLSNELFDVYVITYTADPTYSVDILYVPTEANPCYGFQNLPNYRVGDVVQYESTHKKHMTEHIELKAPFYNDVYQNKLIAVMEYYPPFPINATPPTGQIQRRTNLLKKHWIYENAIAAPNLRRHTEVGALDNKNRVPVKLFNYLNTSDKAETDIEYNSYGLPGAIIGAANDHGHRIRLDFSYDGMVHHYVTQVINSYGDVSYSKYDIATGNLLKTVDLNGHAMRYEYDNMYRLKNIWAPRELYDANSAATISYEYYPKGAESAPSATPTPNDKMDNIPVAYTHHNINTNLPTNITATPNSDINALASLSGRPSISTQLSTETFIDGMQRVIQVKKGSSADVGNHTANTTTKTVSGFTSYDQWGMETQVSNTFQDNFNPLGRLQTSTTMIMNQKTYDYSGRVLNNNNKVPNGGYLNSGHTFEWEVWSGREYPKTISSGIVRAETLTDSRGRNILSRQINALGGNPIETTFNYDPLGQLLSSTDPSNATTTYIYDNFGRTVQEVHPDRGTTDWTFDHAGNMTALSNEGTGSGNITFDYSFNRMISKTMPFSSGIYDVTYTYGTSGDGNNGAGKVVSVVQGTNFKTENYKYDQLGNLAWEEKIIDVPQVGVKTYLTEYKYDSWGRVLQLVYPDNEEVNYEYTVMGDLERITSQIPSVTQSFRIIDLITYDGYGNIQFIKYGNDTETEFQYTSETRSIENVMQRAVDAVGSGIMDAYEQDFTFDPQGRIKSLNQTRYNLANPSTGNINTGHSYTYSYDDFNRLENVTGSFETLSSSGNTSTDAYSLDMSYFNDGRIADKIHSLSNYNVSSYTLDYNYNGQKVHQLDNVSEGGVQTSYQYNDAGSIISRTKQGQTEYFDWNEEEWLSGVSNTNGYHHYVYDHNGERIMKSTVTNASSSNNGQNNIPLSNLDPYTLYVNPYFVVTEFSDYDNLSKHYFMGAQRVSTEVVIYGDGPGGEIPDPNPGGPGGESLSQSNQNVSPLSTLGSATNDSAGYAVLLDLSRVLQNFELQEGVDFDLKELNNAQSIEDYYPMDSLNTNAQIEGEPGSGENDYYPHSRLRYWYHPNYLGNVDMITDENGLIQQYFIYSPFGENLYQWDKDNSFNSPYRFNGKEHDPETGNQYYGARYYDPKTSVWLSVDPMSAERSWLTPYNFVQNNPITRVDPTGMLDTKYEDELGNELANTNDGNNATVVVSNENKEAFLNDFNGTSIMWQDDAKKNQGWISKYTTPKFDPSSLSTTSSSGSSSGDGSSSGLGLSIGGALTTTSQQALNGSSARIFSQKGTKFSPKLYPSGWGGGSAGQIKTYSTSGVATGLKWFGRGLGAYNAVSSYGDFRSGSINGIQFGTDQISNGISTFGGLGGAAWGVGWEMGRTITNTPSYQNWKQNTWLPFRAKTLGY